MCGVAPKFSIGSIVPALEIPAGFGVIEQEVTVGYGGAAPVVTCVAIATPPVAAESLGAVRMRDVDPPITPPQGRRHTAWEFDVDGGRGREEAEDGGSGRDGS